MQPTMFASSVSLDAIKTSAFLISAFVKTFIFEASPTIVDKSSWEN